MLFRTLLITAAFAAPAFVSSAAEPADSRCFELRTYTAAPGKLDDLHARFRNHTMALFAKHGMTNIGYWTPVENAENKLIYVLAYPSRADREKSWADFSANPEWKKVVSESEANGKLVTQVESRFLQATDFSPEIAPGVGATPRLFELRTYTATTNHLPLLLKRFRDHTVALFSRHGMTNLAYWTLASETPGAGETLVYMLAHANKAAAEASWKAFRDDPEWQTAKAASETEAGGSLTIPNGVVSVYLNPTDYSPTR